MWWLALARADAQESGFDAHGFHLATADGDPRAPVRFVRPSDVDGPTWSIGAVGEWAYRPLVFEVDGVRAPQVENLVATDVTGGFIPVDRARVDLMLPVYLVSMHPDGTAGPAVGDLRSSLLLTAVRPEDAHGFGLGVQGALDAPIGDPGRYLGDTGPAGLVALAWTVEVDRFTASASTGARFAPNTHPNERPAPTRGGDTAELGGAVGFLALEELGVGIEGQVALPIDPQVRSAIGVPAEALVSARYRDGSGGWFGGGVGVGIGSGAGASPVRVVIGGGFGAPAAPALPPVADTDGDGLLDDRDACPAEAETANRYRDEDGCADVLPRLRFETRRGDAAEPSAALTVTGPDGESLQGQGHVEVEGLPGDEYTAVARIGACDGGFLAAPIPDEGVGTVVVPIGRADAQVDILVTDPAGRPIDGAEAKYLVQDDACAPRETKLVGGAGTHFVGVGDVLVFLTAPGYGVWQATIHLSPGQKLRLDPKLAPTQVALRDGELHLARPIEFSTGSTLAGSAELLLRQVASLLAGTDGRFEVWAWAPPGGSVELAQARAQAVVDVLVTLGTPVERLVAVGKGPVPRGQKEVVAFRLAGG